MDMSLILYQLSFNYPFHYHTTLIINPYLSCMKEFLYPSLNPCYAMDMSGISTRTLLYDGKVVTANRCLKESICSDCITSTYLIGMNNTFAFLDKYVDPNSQDFDWFDWNLRSIPVTDLLYVTLLYLHPCKHCQRYHHLSSSPMASVTKPDKIPTWSKRPSKLLFWQWSAAKKQKHRCVPAGKTSRSNRNHLIYASPASSEGGSSGSSCSAQLRCNDALSLLSKLGWSPTTLGKCYRCKKRCPLWMFPRCQQHPANEKFHSSSFAEDVLVPIFLAITLQRVTFHLSSCHVHRITFLDSWVLLGLPVKPTLVQSGAMVSQCKRCIW